MTTPLQTSSESIFASGERVEIDPKAFSSDKPLQPGQVNIRNAKMSETVTLRNGVSLISDAHKRTLTIAMATAGVPPVVLKGVSMAVGKELSSVSLSNDTVIQTIYPDGHYDVELPNCTWHLTVDAHGNAQGKYNDKDKADDNWAVTHGDHGTLIIGEYAYKPFISHSMLNQTPEPPSQPTQGTQEKVAPSKSVLSMLTLGLLGGQKVEPWTTTSCFPLDSVFRSVETMTSNSRGIGNQLKSMARGNWIHIGNAGKEIVSQTLTLRSGLQLVSIPARKTITVSKDGSPSYTLKKTSLTLRQNGLSLVGGENFFQSIREDGSTQIASLIDNQWHYVSVEPDGTTSGRIGDNNDKTCTASISPSGIVIGRFGEISPTAKDVEISPMVRFEDIKKPDSGLP